ncbi:MAG: hypothetical protein LZ169_06535 [Thaumarchaeota archaeon]|jgi:uncharacterized C2H2 Zn-finger protein|nr:hypothetical protein [Candidatus Wolframiiraptor allenii]
MAKYLLKCRVCGEAFESYEEHAEHVFSKHPEALWARFRPEIVKEE